MKNVKIGHRKLFLSRGCGISSGAEFRHTFQIAGFKSELYLGKNPNPDLTIVTQSSAVIPFDPRKGQSPATTMAFQKIEESEYQGEFFTDVFTIREIEIEDALFSDLQATETEGKAKDQILNIAKRTHGKDFQAVSNLVAGIIGLRIHYQFVYEIINETFWVWVDRGPYWGPEGAYSSAFHILESPDINANGLQQIRSFQTNPGATLDDISIEAIALTLLIRGWHENNAIYQFIHFFTALEVVTKHFAEGNNPAASTSINKLRGLTEKHLDGDERKNALDFLGKLSVQKSLSLQFEELAEKANFETKRDDIEAFKAFNKVRNRLFHQGDPSDLKAHKTSDGRTIQIQGLAEQYVNWAIFRDGNIYQTKHRNRPAFIKNESNET